MKNNDFLKSTTPEQRAQIRWRQKMLARQGYYPWPKAPFGFDKTRTNGIGGGCPTLKLNADGKVIVTILQMVFSGEIKSKMEAVSFLIAETGLHLTTFRLMTTLKSPNFKGLLKCDNGWVQGKYEAPMTPEAFDQAQVILAMWKGKR